MLKRSRYADDATLKPEDEEEQKCLVMRAKEESARAGSRLNLKKKD